MATVDEQVRIIAAGAVDLITEAELRRKLERGTPLRVKLGIDPTASDIHLGFAVVLRKLRQFQDLGHVAVLIIGDFTAQVGDPTGKSSHPPSRSRTRRSSATPRPTSSRSARSSTSPEPSRDPPQLRAGSAPWTWRRFSRLTARTTVARMLERDDFAEALRRRHAHLAHGVPLPAPPGLADSVEIRGRRRARRHRPALQPPHGPPSPGARRPGAAGRAHHAAARSGLDGEQKMSKSLGNYVGIAEAPAEQFGKVMSLPDEPHAAVLPAHHRLAPRPGRRGGGPSSKSGRRPGRGQAPPRSVRDRRCTTATVRALRPRPSSTRCSGPTRRPPTSPRCSISPTPIDGQIRLATVLRQAVRQREVEQGGRRLIEQGGGAARR